VERTIIEKRGEKLLKVTRLGFNQESFFPRNLKKKEVQTLVGGKE
jgi:hypothetical protein